MKKLCTKKWRVVVWVGVLAGLWFCPGAEAQVRSVTLGIRTHCPYGIRGCWPEIRDGLEGPTDITWINKEPDVRTDTCEVKMRENWAPDPDMFQRNFTNMHIGVDVRGVEVVVDGRLELEGTNLVLRVNGTDTVMHLSPLTRKVQWDKQRKQPEATTSAEQKAFATLAAQFKKELGAVRIVGPLVNATTDSTRCILEVRKFEVIKSAARKA